MNPMSQSKRIQTERTRSTCDHIATPEAAQIRIVLLALVCHRTLKTLCMMVGHPFDQSGDTYLDEGANERFAALIDKDAQRDRIIPLLVKKDAAPSRVFGRAGVVLPTTPPSRVKRAAKPVAGGLVAVYPKVTQRWARVAPEERLSLPPALAFISRELSKGNDHASIGKTLVGLR